MFTAYYPNGTPFTEIRSYGEWIEKQSHVDYMEIEFDGNDEDQLLLNSCNSITEFFKFHKDFQENLGAYYFLQTGRSPEESLNLAAIHPHFSQTAEEVVVLLMRQAKTPNLVKNNVDVVNLVDDLIENEVIDTFESDGNEFVIQIGELS